ncbi:MAG: outer membrane lipid asymmetry maintenance protein MlaD [Alphaproteobacteria bacterium]|nr:outer membrane lipid asymmetry maintenance protein MlaD [Alphaproteobacteria bacterium]
MKRSVVETILGAVVILGAAAFFLFGYKVGNVATPSGFDLSADFSGIGGLAAGDDVQISGVKVGSVTDVELDAQSYLARVHMSLDPGIELPTDTAAVISSESLLGGRYLALEPGADEEMIKSGGRIQYTQAPQNLEQLLGEFIFSVSEADDKNDKQAE